MGKGNVCAPNSAWGRDEDAAERLEPVCCCPFSRGAALQDGRWGPEESRGQTDGLCQPQRAPVFAQDARQLAAISLGPVSKGSPLQKSYFWMGLGALLSLTALWLLCLGTSTSA